MKCTHKQITQLNTQEKECYLIGAGSLLISSAMTLLKHGYIIRRIFSDDIPTKQWAQETNLQTHPISKIYSHNKPVSYIFSINNTSILPQAFLILGETAAINYHNSKLPTYAGINAPTWAILNGEKKHGVTWHLMSNHVDAGDVIQQKIFSLTKNDTALSTNLKCHEAALSSFEILVKNLGSIKTTPQNLSLRSYYATTTQIPMNALVSWNTSANNISAMIRSVDFGNQDNPLSRVKIIIGDTIYIIYKVTVSHTKSNAIPGTIIKIDKRGLHIGTTTNIIIIAKFYTIDNHQISLHNILKKHTITIGNRLPTIKAKQATNLEQNNQKAHTHEIYILQQFNRYKYLTLPYSILEHSSSKQLGRQHYKIRFDTKTLQLIKTNYPRQTKIFFLTALALYFSKICNTETISSGLLNETCSSLDSLTQQIFSRIIPLTIDIDLNNNFTSLFNSVSELTGKLSNIECYASDILIRHKELQTLAKIDAAFPIIISLAEDEKNISNIKHECFIKITKDGYEITLHKGDNTKFCPNLNNIKVLIENISQHPNIPTKDLCIVSADEMHRAYYAWNNNNTALKSRCIHDGFTSALQKNPKKPAITLPNKTLTYAELNTEITKVIQQISHLPKTNNNLIGVLLQNKLQQIIAALAITISGHAYAPIAITDPAQRINKTLRSCKISAVIADQSIQQKITVKNTAIININNTQEYTTTINKKIPSPQDLAYLIFTSGSTGTPKGVAIEHASAYNTIADINQKFSVNSQDTVLAVSAFNFDLSVYDIFGTLAAGGTIALASKVHSNEPSAWLNALNTGTVTIWNSVPSLMKMLIQYLESNKNIRLSTKARHALRLVLLSGDWIPTKLPKQIKHLFPEAQIISLGGATEASIWSVYYPISRVPETWHSIPYGKPLNNQQIYILDKQLIPRPVGVPGDIYIGGKGLARYYYNDKTSTKKHFVQQYKLNNRIYWTGDRGYYQPDGTIGFLGRIDNQVKIRGFRVELEEIKASLKSYYLIKDAIIILLQKDHEEQQLTAYYTAKKPNIDKLKLHKHIAKQLPNHMTPNLFIEVAKFNLTSSGKIDETLLPTQFAHNHANKFAPGHHSNIKEEIITNIWRDVLKKEKITNTDDFFAIGGNSLLATVIISRINMLFKTNLLIKSIFTHPTILKAAELINDKKNYTQSLRWQKIAKSPIKNHIKLSFAQQRLWFLYKMNPQSPFYNMQKIFKITGQLNTTILKKSLDSLAKKHEILRTTFKLIGHKTVQCISNDNEFPLKIISNQDHTGWCNSKIEEILTATTTSLFDLERGPLCRALLLRASKDTHWFCLSMHHIISDAWSMDILMQELSTIYISLNSGQKPYHTKEYLQYKDFSTWQNSWLKDEALNRQLKYWKKQLTNLPPFSIPIDFPRPSLENFQGKSYSFAMPQGAYTNAKRLAKKYNGTLFTVLLTAFSMMLYRYTLQEDIVIGTSIANRNYPGTEGIVGFFANTLVIRTQINSTDNFAKCIEHINEFAITAYDNQDVPFEKLVEELSPNRSLTANPLFKIAFVLLNTSGDALSIPGLECTEKQIDNGVSKFDLTLYIKESASGLESFIEYSTSLFREESIATMGKHFNSMLSSVANEPEKNILEIPLFTSKPHNENRTQKSKNNLQFITRKSLPELFEKQAKKYATMPATTSGEYTLTYDELNKLSNRIAHCLIKMGVGKGHNIAIFLKRSDKYITSILGVLKAGAAYVPLDASYPKARVQFIIGDAEVRAILSEESLWSAQDNTIIPVIYPENVYENIDYSEEDPKVSVHPCDPAYIIYTSGTTGTPNGVVVSHKNIIRLYIATANWFNFTNQDTWILTHSFAFDFSVWEIFGALLHGGNLVILSHHQSRSPKTVCQTILEKKVTILNQTPTAFYGLMQYAEDMQETISSNLRFIIFGGEKLDYKSLQRWFKANPSSTTKLVNMYGITEATVHATYHLISESDTYQDASIIGQAIPDLQLHVLDEHLTPVPFGMPGELYIAGAGVASGYFQRDKLTSKRFISSSLSNRPIYKTGDLVRWNTPTKLEYLRRTDKQLKVRGYRINPEEIENRLRQYPDIQEAAVVNKENIGDYTTTQLAAYLTIRSNTEHDNDHEQQWETLYDRLYTNDDSTNHSPGFNIAGWNHSHNNRPIPANAMQEWLNATIENIRELHPTRILEIGCGTGLLLHQLAPKSESYCGIDASSKAITNIKHQLQALKLNLPQLTLLRCTARNMKNIVMNQFDTVILNSVVQYFPSIEYLREVLQNILHDNIEKGYIYIGDVRDLRLLREFHLLTQYRKHQKNLAKCDFTKLVEHGMSQERELLIDPGFFLDLPKHFSKITGVTIKLKKGNYHNELNKFRYDVILHINQSAAFLEHKWLNFNDQDEFLGYITQQLQQETPVIAIKGIQNKNLMAPKAIDSWTKDTSQTPFLKICELLRRQNWHDPNSLYKIAEQHQYKAYISPDLSADSHCFNAIFIKNSNTNKLPLSQNTNYAHSNKYANKPIRHMLDMAALRDFLAKTLPNYMIPANIYIIERMPLTINGKTDYCTLSTLNSKRLQRCDSYVPPSTKEEQILVKIWSNVLQIEIVGIDDNFFELGGDSIIAIIIISEANKLGLNIDPKNIFLHQTVRALAKFATTNTPKHQLQNIAAKGSAPLSPIQHWLLENSSANPDHWNQAVLLTISNKVTPKIIASSMEIITKHHSSFRLRFHTKGETTKQAYIGKQSTKNFTLTQAQYSTQKDIVSICQRANMELNITKGPLFRLVILQNKSSQQHLLAVAHHLIMDGVSWRVFIEDLAISCTALSTKTTPILAKSLSYKTWTTALMESAHKRHDTKEELRFWTDRLPPSNSSKSADTFSNEEFISTQVPFKPLQHNTYELLLTTTTIALANLLKTNTLFLALENHGRITQQEGLDITRTLGVFTSLYPAKFTVNTNNDFAMNILQIKKELELLRGRESNYGVLRYLSQNKNTRVGLQGRKFPTIMFNYLGILDKNQEQNSLIQLDKYYIKNTRGKNNIRPFSLEINCFVLHDTLHIDFIYSKKTHKSSDIYALRDSVIKTIKTVCDNPTDRVIPLQPMQINLLHDMSFTINNNRYFHQMRIRMEGELDRVIYQRAWAILQQRYPALRTYFTADRINMPQQKISPTPLLKFKYIDISHNNSNQEHLTKLMQQSRQEVFMLDTPPLMSITLIKLTKHTHYVIWNYHQLIVDGVSIYIILNSLANTYKSLANKKETSTKSKQLPYSAPSVTHDNSTIFWQKYLQGKQLSHTPLLDFFQRPAAFDATHSPYSQLRYQFSREATEHLQTFAKINHVSLNSAIQMLWGLLLRKYSHTDSIMYGVMLLGSRNDFKESSKLVGNFMHLSPFALNITPDHTMTKLAQKTQINMTEIAEHASVSLTKISSLLQLQPNTTLFDTVLTFQNYMDSYATDYGTVYLNSVEYFIRTNYPLTLRVIPGTQITFDFCYDSKFLDKDTITIIFKQLNSILHTMIKA